MVDILHPKLVYKSSIFDLEPDSFGNDSKLMREPVLVRELTFGNG